jgi:hypothetical protein
MFTTVGSAGDVATTLGRICRSLTDLPLDHLATQADLLRSESQQRSGTPSSAILAALFGMHGPGLNNHIEWGFQGIDGSTLQTWADSYFTAENAVLMLDGPPPDNLALSLLPGSRHFYRVPDPGEYSRPGTTRRIQGWPGNIALGTVLSRTYAAATAVAVAAQRLTDQLRHHDGYVYAVLPIYLPLDRDTAFAYLGVDCEEERAQQAARRFMDTLGELAEAGPSDDEIGRAMSNPGDLGVIDPAELARGELRRFGIDHLLGHDHEPLSVVLEKGQGVAPDEVRSSISEIIRHSIVVAPPGVLEDIPAPTTRSTTEQVVEGMFFWPQLRHPNAQLRTAAVNGEALSVKVADDQWFVFRWHEIALAIRNEGGWSLHRDDGAFVQFDMAYWRDSHRLANVLDDHIPRGVIVSGNTQASRSGREGEPRPVDDDKRPSRKPESLLKSPSSPKQASVWKPPKPTRAWVATHIGLAIVAWVLGGTLVLAAGPTENGRGQEYVESVTALGAISVCVGLVLALRVILRRR